jgi:Xaa-Pro aminopeptidase
MVRKIDTGSKGSKKGATVATKGATKKGATKGATVAPTVAAKESATVRKAFTHKGASPYAPLKGTAKGAFTCAALIVSGLLRLIGEKAEKGSEPSLALFRAIVGDAPIAHHRKAGNIAGGALTDAGVTFFANRNAGNGKTYNTDREIVDAMVNAMRKGGTVHIGADALTFDKEIKVG